MATKNFKCLKTKQDGKILYLTPMKTEDLIEYSRINRYRPNLEWTDPDQGYQRREEPRLKKLKSFMERTDRLLPTTFTLNNRDGIQYNEETSEITLDTENKPYLIDGQHRRAGLIYAIDKSASDPDQQRGIRNFVVPVVILSGFDKVDEMKQFKIINDTQKKIRTDLVNAILTQIERTHGEEEISDAEKWKVVCQDATHLLNSDDNSPWKELIVLPGEVPITRAQRTQNPGLEHAKIIKSTSVTTSLKPIYYLLSELGLLRGTTLEEYSQYVAEIVQEFWSALKELNDGNEMFQNPGDYVLQKTPGMFSLHMLLKKMMPRMFAAREEWKKENFIQRLQNAPDTHNPEFWDKTGDGAARFGSMKGFAELSEILWDQLYE